MEGHASGEPGFHDAPAAAQPPRRRRAAAGGDHRGGAGDPGRDREPRRADPAGDAATSIYLHFPDTEHLAVAATSKTFAELTAAAAAAAAGISDPGQELLARCRAYCHFALEHPVHYKVMFHLDLAPSLAASADGTPGRRAFQVLVQAVQACQDAGVATATGDPFRLASLVWAAEHGLVSLRLARPQFPWSDLDGLVDEAVTKIVGLQPPPAR